MRDAGGLYSHVGYPNEEWTLFELEFDCNTHLYQYSFDGQAGGEFRLQNEALIENRYIIFIVYNDVSIDYVFIDDLQIEQVLPDEEFQTIPNFRGRGTAIGVSDMFDSMKILK
ncbi:hypothetical protein H8D57_01225 [bacterium]|nr:hypothetical protein [bacterium]